MFVFLIALTLSISSPETQIEAAKAVIRRNVPECKIDEGKIVFEYINKENGCDVFITSSKDGVLTIFGSSGVAFCHGFYMWMKKYHYGMITWKGTRVVWPSTIPDTPRWRVVSPVKHHYNYNVVTFGYTTPFYDFDHWRKEIDWMALHGYDMPLALIGLEAIATRVWRKMGLTEDEINNYYCGPAYLPWQRMGNLIHHDGHLNDDWHEQTIALQHKLLDAYADLGFTPICPAFPGFIPRAIKERLYPNVLTFDLGAWMGEPPEEVSTLLAPNESLFTEIGSNIVKEYEKEFGKQQYYIADTFNEMSLPEMPTPEAKLEFLAKMGKGVYDGVRVGNPDAVWVMQGWSFGNNKYIWDEDAVRALFSLVPNDKMLILDLATDYNKYWWFTDFNWVQYDSFFGKPFVYSVIPNMGGKSVFNGPLEYYANGHLNPLSDPRCVNMEAIGTAPEGFENNEMIYELYTDVFWKNETTDLGQWWKDYAINRYGLYNDNLKKSWELLNATVYGRIKNYPVFAWQYQPPTTQGDVDYSEEFVESSRQWSKASDTNPELVDNFFYQTDLIESVINRLGVKMEFQVRDLVDKVNNKRWDEAKVTFANFKELMQSCESLVQNHPHFRLDRWLDLAAKWGKTEEQKAYYIEDAKRLITVWGTNLNDYSARIWGGIVGHYYLPRWEHWFNCQLEGTDPKMGEWEENWVMTSTYTPDPPIKDIVKACKDALKLADQMP